MPNIIGGTVSEPYLLMYIKRCLRGEQELAVP